MKRELTKDELGVVEKRIKALSEKVIELDKHKEYYLLHAKHALAITNYQFLKLTEDHIEVNTVYKKQIIDDYKVFLNELNDWYKDNVKFKAASLVDNYSTQIAKIGQDVRSYTEAVKLLEKQKTEGIEIKEKKTEEVKDGKETKETKDNKSNA